MSRQEPFVVRETEAARILGVSKAALRRWRRERRGPDYVRIERCIGYRVTDLEAFVNSRTVAMDVANSTQEGMRGGL